MKLQLTKELKKPEKKYLHHKKSARSLTFSVYFNSEKDNFYILIKNFKLLYAHFNCNGLNFNVFVLFLKIILTVRFQSNKT